MVKIKRCIIDPYQFRVSTPGVDVSSANPYDFMLHENFLSAQPYFFTKVNCPFAGYIGGDLKKQSVNVTVPDVDPTPEIIFFPISSGSLNTYPVARDEGSGNDQTGYNIDYWDIYAKAISSTQISVTFEKYGGGRKSPQGCYMALVRSV